MSNETETNDTPKVVEGITVDKDGRLLATARGLSSLKWMIYEDEIGTAVANGHSAAVEAWSEFHEKPDQMKVVKEYAAMLLEPEDAPEAHRAFVETFVKLLLEVSQKPDWKVALDSADALQQHANALLVYRDAKAAQP